jgi:hypothetical protein
VSRLGAAKRPTADEGPRRTSSGDQIRRPRHCAGAEPLEEKLLYPSGTQVAIFVALAKGDQMRLDAVRLQIDGQLVAHYIYSFKELEALRKGGVQRIYVGNVATGDHKLEVLVDGKLRGRGFQPHGTLYLPQGSEAEAGGLTLAGRFRHTPIALGNGNRCEPDDFIDWSGLDLRARPAGRDLRTYFGEALYHAPAGKYFDALQRLDTSSPCTAFWMSPNSIRCLSQINDAEFRSGDFRPRITASPPRRARHPRLCSKGAVD